MCSMELHQHLKLVGKGTAPLPRVSLLLQEVLGGKEPTILNQPLMCPPGYFAHPVPSLYWEPWGFEAIFGILPLVRLCFGQEEHVV